MLTADIEARAGASDTDRTLWLAERARGVTATEVAKLATGGTVDALVRDKIEGSSFGGNRYTAWGKAREPFLEQHMSGFGIDAESRVFSAVDNPRHLASPDGIGVDFDGNVFLGEGKTSRDDLDPQGGNMPDQYLYQMQWQMHVIGANRCLFVWEQHNNVWPTPDPYPIRSEWIDRDQAVIDKLITLADHALTALDDAIENGLPAVDTEAETLGLLYAQHRDVAKEAKTGMADAQARLIAHAKEDPFSMRTDRVLVTVKPARTELEEQVDEARLMECEKGLWNVIETARAELAELEADWLEKSREYTHMVDVEKKATVTVTIQNKGKKQ